MVGVKKQTKLTLVTPSVFIDLLSIPVVVSGKFKFESMDENDDSSLPVSGSVYYSVQEIRGRDKCTRAINHQ